VVVFEVAPDLAGGQVREETTPVEIGVHRRRIGRFAGK
jgi:hypothetical protein